MGIYTVERRLGRGGMATVYLAKDPDGRSVALKVMLPQLAFETSFLERFLREVEATRSLKHRNVVEVLGAGEQDGLPYMACEYVEGGSLETMLEECPKLASPLALEIGAQLLEGLAHAHTLGIVHRDLKPANLLLTTGGVLKVADFGVAKVAGASSLTRTGALFGTPAYMSPEQAQGLNVDARSDIFSAGVILYELLTSVNPHKTEDPSAALLRVQLGVPPIAEVEPTITPAVEQVVEKMLEREPELRYQTAGDALLALRPLVEEMRQKHPALLVEGLLDPAGVSKRLRAEQAEGFRQRARQLVSDSSFVPAALWLHRSLLLDGENQAAQKLFAQVCQREGLSFAATQNPKVAELEALIARGPDNAKALLQLAQLFRIEGNPTRSVACLKRVLRLRPGDVYVASQLTQLTGERFLAKLSSSNLAQGIDTGGHAASRRARPVAGALQPPPYPTSPLTPAVEGQALRGPQLTAPTMLAASSGPRPLAPPLSAPPTPGALGLPPQSSQLRPEILVQLPPAATRQVAVTTPLQQLWRAYGKRLVTLAVVSGVLFWAVRRVGQMIERATQETERAGAELRKGMHDEGPAGGVDEALRARLAANARDAARALEAASALFRKGDYGQAVSVCDSILDRFPKLPEATEAAFLRGRSLFLAGRTGEALDALGRFIANERGSPHYGEALLRTGEAYLKAGDAASALLPLDELIRTMTDNPFVTEAYLRRGEALTKKGDVVSAEADYRIVMSRVGPADALYQQADAALKLLPARLK